MTAYLLDTNVVSELRKPKPHGAVLAWFERVPDKDLYLSVVTLAEIQAGIEITRDQDAEKARGIEHWADMVAQTYNLVSMDGPTIRLWARLMHRQSDSLYEDAMIAATALIHGLTVATRNTRDFARFDVSTFDPFQSERGA